MPSIPDSQLLQTAILRAIDTWSSARGQVVFPCIPQQFENYVRRFQLLFDSLGRPFSPRELTGFCTGLKQELDRGDREGNNRYIAVRYDPGKPPQKGLICRSSIIDPSVDNVVTQGTILLPCIPHARSLYQRRFENLFSALGHPLKPEEIEQVGRGLEVELKRGYDASPYSRLVIRYGPNQQSGKGFVFRIDVFGESIDDRTRSLVNREDRSLFGNVPDAKVTNIVATLNPQNGAILDIGAATGRNTIPLLRSGFTVDAVDLSVAFLDRLSDRANQEDRSVNVIQGNILDADFNLERDRYQFAIASSFLPHLKSTEQLAQVMAKLSDSLRSSGLLLVNLFVATEGYEPDAVTLELSHALDSFVFSRSQFEAIVESLPLSVVSNESVLEYEKNHIESESWPPTPWFENWASGRRLFPVEQGKPPMELRWILLEKAAQ